LNALIKLISEKLGITRLQDEILSLKSENEQLKATLKEHEQGIAYVAVLQSRILKDMLYLVQKVNTPEKKQNMLRVKKPSDDLIN
jgi:hypothetical protein